MGFTFGVFIGFFLGALVMESRRKRNKSFIDYKKEMELRDGLIEQQRQYIELLKKK